MMLAFPPTLSGLALSLVLTVRYQISFIIFPQLIMSPKGLEISLACTQRVDSHCQPESVQYCGPSIFAITTWCRVPDILIDS